MDNKMEYQKIKKYVYKYRESPKQIYLDKLHQHITDYHGNYKNQVGGKYKKHDHDSIIQLLNEKK